MRISQKGSEDLTIKSIFAIFTVIFLMFVIMTLLGSRTSSQKAKFTSEYYALATSFLKAMIASDCFAYKEKEGSWTTASQAVLYQQKLDYYNRGNEDISCVEQYDFLYTFRVVDSLTGKEWRIGLLNEPQFAEDTLTIALPIAIRYPSEVPTINPGFASITAYIGSIPSFYGKIKQACRSHEGMQHILISDYNIRYDNFTNTFYVGEYLFFPRFECSVGNFTIPKGKSLVLISYNESSNSVRVKY
ncbi:MAG: hypothetical protein QXW00_00325 [Candidatus Woesearchaeota archaeon]